MEGVPWNIAGRIEPACVESPLSDEDEDGGGDGALDEQSSSKPFPCGRVCHFSYSSPELEGCVQRG